MFQTEVTERIKTYILLQNSFFQKKPCRFGDNVGKFGRSGRATDWQYNTAHAPYMLDN